MYSINMYKQRTNNTDNLQCMQTPLAVWKTWSKYES